MEDKEIDYKKAWEDLKEGMTHSFGTRENPHESVLLAMLLDQMQRMEINLKSGRETNFKLR